MRHRTRRPSLSGGLRRIAALVLVAPLVVPPLAASGQASQDAAAVVQEARDRQRDFERFRQSRIPVDRDDGRGQCDEQIGRICIWFGGEGERNFPPEPPETDEARRGLIGVLLETDQQVDDPWVTGQLVHYLVEQRDFRLAEQTAQACEIPQAWWCSALLGYSLHVRGEFVAAEAAFREALEAMPDAEWERWTSLHYVLAGPGEEAMDGMQDPARLRAWETFWRLSDPLFLMPGNDRLTDHFARLVEARNHRDAAHPQGMEWDDDLEETLVRYGRIEGWSRTHSPGFSPPGRFQVRDTRRVVGHHHPQSRGYLFPGEFLESPSDIPPESWITAPRESRTWYAPPYAPHMRGLETQVGRFRRGENMLVVGAYRPVLRADRADGDAAVIDPFATIEGPVDAALFLVPEEGGEVDRVLGDAPEGVLTLQAAPGRYVSSLEVLDDRSERAWRARQGVKQVPLEPGTIDVSDLLLLRPNAPMPERLDEAIPHVRPGVRVRRGERFTVVWEVYGLRVREPVQVTLGFTRGRPGFLSRVGEFLGIVEPDEPVEVTFSEQAPEAVETVFRSMTMELPDLDAGDYTLHLRLELPGREPVIASRPIVVVD